MDPILDKAEEIKKDWENIFDSITDPIAILDDNHKLIRVNKAYAKASSITLKKIPKLTCYFLFQKRKSPCENCNLHSPKPFTLVSKNKSVYGVSIIPVENTTHFLIYYRDITEMYTLHKKLSKISKESEIGILSASIAHELNNPLSGILAFIQILRKNKDIPVPLKNHLSKMEQSARLCHQKIEDMLAISRKIILFEN